jgi:hypothetical protein
MQQPTAPPNSRLRTAIAGRRRPDQGGPASDAAADHSGDHNHHLAHRAPIPVNTCGCGEELRSAATLGPFLRCSGWVPGAAATSDDDSDDSQPPRQQAADDGQQPPRHGWWTGSALFVTKSGGQDGGSDDRSNDDHRHHHHHLLHHHHDLLHKQHQQHQPTEPPAAAAPPTEPSAAATTQPVLRWRAAAASGAAGGPSDSSNPNATDDGQQQRVQSEGEAGGELLDEWCGWRFWRFELRVPVADGEREIRYEISGGSSNSSSSRGDGGSPDGRLQDGQPLSFFVPGAGCVRGLQLAAISSAQPPHTTHQLTSTHPSSPHQHPQTNPPPGARQSWRTGFYSCAGFSNDVDPADHVTKHGGFGLLVRVGRLVCYARWLAARVVA